VIEMGIQQNPVIERDSQQNESAIDEKNSVIDPKIEEYRRGQRNKILLRSQI